MHVDDDTGTDHNMRCWVSIAGRGKSFQCGQVDPLWPKSFDQSETGIFWSRHFSHCVFCSRTPNHLPKWFTQYGFCISPTSPISGGASSQYGLDITMAWMKFSTSGMSAFGPSPHRPHQNHGRKFVCDTIGIWHTMSRHYLGIVGSRGFWLGNHRAANALAAQNIAGIVWLQIFAAWRIYLHGRSLQLILTYGVQICLTLWSSASVDVYRISQFFPPVLETGCPMGHTGLTVDRIQPVAMHFALLPHDRWIQRMLKWTPGGRYAAGCPRHNWVTKISAFVLFCKWMTGKDWHKICQFGSIWRRSSFNSADVKEYLSGRSLSSFCNLVYIWGRLFTDHLRPNGLPAGMQVWLIDWYTACAHL